MTSTKDPQSGRTYILGMGAYLPERIMTNDEWGQYVDTSDEWITARTGIKRRRIAAPDETTVDFAVAAARSALEQAEIRPHDLEEIIVATDTPEVCVPDTAAFVQHKLCAREIPAYDLASSGCAGFIQALDVARARVFFGVGPILVVGVELVSRLINWHDRNTCVLFGDAAAAFVVGAGPGQAEILSAVTGTDGSKAGILMIEVGGTRHPFNAETAREESHKRVTMNGREVFKEAVHRMSEGAQTVLAKAGFLIEDLDLVIPHQANLRIIEAVAKSLGLTPDKLYVNIQEYGNTGSASVPLALWEAQQRGLIKPGGLVLLTSFGAGFHWGATLLRF
ncbi:MAG: ketoacyl-ACP synthase III [Acidobacteriota bacterium]|nr:ketoacyl-ACP synthase III [Acidobacteriota bacterium]MDQ5835481.1 ketoacyl-ACP synthase III [Acidobacteriota bacterium]